MTSLKNLTRNPMLQRTFAIHRTTNNGGHKTFLTAAAKNLQKLFDSRSKKEKEADEACEKALEAAESLKEGANEVKETCEFVRDTVETTSESVKDATREVREKVTEASDAVKEKMIKDPIKGLASDVWGAATKKIEDKVVEKIRSRVLGEAAQVEVKGILDKSKNS